MKHSFPAATRSVTELAAILGLLAIAVYEPSLSLFVILAIGRYFAKRPRKE